MYELGTRPHSFISRNILYQIRRPLGLAFVIYFWVAGRIVAALYLAEL
jgi:hypothetical protein